MSAAARERGSFIEREDTAEASRPDRTPGGYLYYPNGGVPADASLSPRRRPLRTAPGFLRL